MDKNVFISYIIPCYNVQDYLPRCLESLAIQKIEDGANIEFILINDGSKDGTLDLLKEFAGKDERAIIVDQQNQGVCSARNNGFKLARGKYVFFLDGDDFLTDEASQLIYDESKKNESDIIIPSAYYVLEGDVKQKYEWNPFDVTRSGVYTTLQFVDSLKSLPISVKAYKREVLINHDIWFDEDLKVGEVYTYFIHVLAFSQFVTLTNGRMMNYVTCNSGTTKGYNIERDRSIVNTMHRIDDYSRLFFFDPKSKSSYMSSLFQIVSLFSIAKYPQLSKCTPEIASFLNTILKDDIYRSTLKFFITNHALFSKMFLYAVFLYYLPIRGSYCLLRCFRELKLELMKICNILFRHANSVKILIIC